MIDSTMEIDFEKLMANKSDEGLMNYVEKIDIYTEEAVVAAVLELKKRGKLFSEEDLKNIRLKLDDKKKAKIAEEKEWEKSSLTRNVVTDENAPAYYSHRAIWGFSVVFTVIFGAVLFSSNLKGKGNARWIVLGFGIIYTGVAIFLLSLVPRNTGLTIGVNGAGAWIMTQFFWNKYLGEDTKYRAKSILKPLIISIVVSIPFILAAIYGGLE
jgi:hypothetical protein